MKIPIAILKDLLANSDFPQTASAGLKISSVMMPFYFTKENEMGVLLTKRSDFLKNHPGQISFPGGQFDHCDKTLAETALREWEEETGETRDTIEILGSYHTLNTGTGFHITPFISIYRGNFNFHLNKNEVDYLIMLELDKLFHVPFYTIRLEHHLSGRTNLYYFDLPEGLLWGATCHMLYHFLKEFCGFTREPDIVKQNLSSAPFFSPLRI